MSSKDLLYGLLALVGLPFLTLGIPFFALFAVILGIKKEPECNTRNQILMTIFGFLIFFVVVFLTLKLTMLRGN